MSIEKNATFEYVATGINKDGNEVKFGGTAATLGDVLGGVFGHGDVEVTEWTATQCVEYWRVKICGVKAGESGCEVKFTFKEPKESSALIAGLAVGFDLVRHVSVEAKKATRKEVDDLIAQRKEDWI